MKNQYMSLTFLYDLVETPYMGRTDPIWLEKVLIYGSSVKSISGKVPYIWSPSQSISGGKSISLYFGCLNLYFGCLNLYRCTLGV